MKRLVLLTLVLLLAVPAFAQGVAFQSSSLPRQMRGEGITETAGDVVLLATNTGTVKAGSSITVVYGAPVTATGTNFLTLGGVVVGGVTCTNPGDVGFPTANCPTAAISSNTITISFPADAVFTAFTSSLVINNIRVDASGFSGGSTISAFASGVSSVPGTFPVSFTNPSVIVGLVVKPSMTASAVSSSAVSVVTCNAVTGTFKVKVAENYPAAFTSLKDEQNFTPRIAQVTNGSIIQATVSGVPSGVRVDVLPHIFLSGTTTDNSAVTSVQIAKITIGTSTANITTLLGTSAGPASSSTAAAGADQTFAISFGGNAGATTDTAHTEDLQLDFTLVPVATTPLSAPATITVTLKLIPGPTTISTSPNKTPIVRFADTTLGTFTIGTVGNCTSALLFPFIVTGIAGFDTSIAIANTTLDPLGSTLGAAAQSGTCTLTMFPTPDVTAPGTVGTSVSVTSPTIAAGGTWATPLSKQTGFLGLEGYMFAVCNFLNAHGFAIITNGFGTGAAQTLNQGYLPLVVPTTGAGRAAAGQAEGLGQ